MVLDVFWQVDVCYPKAAEFLCMRIGEGVSENALESLKKMRIDGLMRVGIFLEYIAL